MSATDILSRINYYTDRLGGIQIKADEAIKWGMIPNGQDKGKSKKAFIYLNSLSRFRADGTGTLSQAQAETILTQLEKLIP